LQIASARRLPVLRALCLPPIHSFSYFSRPNQRESTENEQQNGHEINENYTLVLYSGLDFL
jgi:hypothetical protein